MPDPARGYKILIVDDDKFLLDMYSHKFSEHNFEIVTAPDAEEALEKLEGGFQPDICLLDVLLPKQDGFGLAEKIKEKNLPNNPAIILLSNMGQPEDIEHGLRLGVDGYIVKATATPSEVVAKTIEITASKNKEPK